MKKRLNVAFDLDGTCINLKKVMDDVVKEYYDDVFVDHNEFKLKTNNGLDQEGILNVIEIACSRIDDIEPYEGVQKLFETLYSITKEPIPIVTARPSSQLQSAHDVVEKFSTVPFFIGYAKGWQQKFKFLTRYSYYVEDRRKTAFDLANRGKIVYLLARDYNKILNKERHFNIIRIGNIEDLILVANNVLTTII